LIPSSTLHAPLRHSFPFTICGPQASNTIDRPAAPEEGLERALVDHGGRLGAST